jgi:hypothetical protein
MEVAPQHAKGKRIASGVEVEKGLFFDGIDCERSNIAVGDPQFAALIEAYLADAAPAFRDEASVAACDATDSIAFGKPKLASRGMGIEHIRQAGRVCVLPWGRVLDLCHSNNISCGALMVKLRAIFHASTKMGVDYLGMFSASRVAARSFSAMTQSSMVRGWSGSLSRNIR